MKKLSKDEMKSLLGGQATEVLMITGSTQNGNTCTVDFCYVNVETGAVSGCVCDVPATCPS